MEERLINQLITYTEGNIERQQYGTRRTAGEDPYYPIMVLHFGKGQEESCRKLSHALISVWPAFQQEIPFLAVVEKGTDYDVLTLQEDGTLGNAVDFQEAADNCFDIQHHFHSYDKIILNIVVDTADLDDVSAFQQREKIIEDLKLQIEEIGHECSVAIYYLLNERGKGTALAKEIKQEIAHAALQVNTARFVLSNRFHNRTVLMPKDDDRWKLVRSLILLSDDVARNGSIFSKDILTVKYSKLEKDNRDISSSVLKELLNCMDGKRREERDALNLENILNRMGISTMNGKFELLDRYVLSKNIDLNRILYSLPRGSEEQLNIGINTELTEAELDQITMGAWSAYINSVVNQLAAEILNNVNIKAALKDEYGSLLSRNLNVYDFVYIQDHFSTIKEKIEARSAKWPSNIRVSQIIQSVLIYYMAQKPEITELFYDVIKEKSKDANACKQELDALLDDIPTLPRTNDQEVHDFYAGITRRYLNEHMQEISAVFGSLSVPEFRSRIRQLLDKITALPIFNSNFLGEIQQRLNATPEGAANYIWNRLYGTAGNRQYLRTTVELSSPSLSVVLLKQDSELQRLFAAALVRTDYGFYNTGNEDSIEAIQIFEIDRNDLLTE